MPGKRKFATPRPGTNEEKTRRSWPVLCDPASLSLSHTRALPTKIAFDHTLHLFAKTNQSREWQRKHKHGWPRRWTTVEYSTVLY